MLPAVHKKPSYKLYATLSEHGPNCLQINYCINGLILSRLYLKVGNDFPKELSLIMGQMTNGNREHKEHHIFNLHAR